MTEVEKLTVLVIQGMCYLVLLEFFPEWTIQIGAIDIFLYAVIIFNCNMAVSLSAHQYLNTILDKVYTKYLYTSLSNSVIKPDFIVKERNYSVYYKLMEMPNRT